MMAIKRLYWKWLYRKIDSSFIYEVVKDNTRPNQVFLYGPITSETIKIAVKKEYEASGHSYVQVINGNAVAFFKPDELLFSKVRL